MGDLTELFEQLKSEIERQLGHEIYSSLLESEREWGLYATENRKGNFGFVIKRVRSDKWLPNCPLPHLRVGTKKEWANDAGVTPENVKPRGFYGIDDEAWWCVPKGDDEKLKKVAKCLKAIYLKSPAQRKWQEG